MENRLCELTMAAIVQSQGAGIGFLHNQDSVLDWRKIKGHVGIMAGTEKTKEEARYHFLR